MDATHTPPTTDPVALLQQLDADAIRRRLADLERERSALLVLLRAARRMQHDEPALRERVVRRAPGE
jgi:hypothetical protein